MDQEKKELFEEINGIYNSRFQCETIGNILYHMPIYNAITSKYNKYTFSDFIFIWRTECLFDNGIITLERKKDILELFNIYNQLIHKLGTKENSDEEDIILNKIEDIKKVFNNYHLCDDIDLVNLISNSVKVDNSNIDMSEVLKILKH